MSPRHQYYLRRNFRIREFQYIRLNMSATQFSILQRYGYWFLALDRGYIEPETEAQKRFVAVCRGEVMAVTEHERAWRYYKSTVAADEAEIRGRQDADNALNSHVDGLRKRIEELGEEATSEENLGLWDALADLESERQEAELDRSNLF